MDFIQKFKSLRGALALTQAKAAEALGIPQRTIENWERGVNAPSPWIEKLILKEMNNLLRVGEILEVDGSWLVDWQYLPSDFRVGDNWIVALRGREITYLEEDNFKNKYEILRDPDCGWGPEDDVFRTSVVEVLPVLKLRIQSTLNISVLDKEGNHD